MNHEFLDRNFARWKKPVHWSVDEKVETTQGSVTIHLAWDVFEDVEAWIYQRYLERENVSTIEYSYDLLRNQPGKLAEIYFSVLDGSAFPEELNTRNRAKVSLKLKRIFYDNFYFPKKEYRPNVGDILVGYPFAVGKTSRMFDKVAPGGSEKRSLLYSMGGMGNIKDDKYQYGVYNKELRIAPL